MNTEIAYWLGMWVGDGHMIFERKRVSDGSDALRAGLVVKQDQVESLHQFLGTKHFNIVEHESAVGEAYYSYQTRDREICEYIDRTCGRSHEKRVPDNLTDEEKWSFLSGFIDSDGNVGVDRVHLCNCDMTIIEGLKRMLDSLDIHYSEFTQKTKNQPCIWLILKAEDLPRTKFDLRISYKRKQYEKLRSRTKGRRVELGKDFMIEHRAEIKEVLPGTTFHRRYNKERWYLLEEEYSKLEKYWETRGISRIEG